MNGFVMLKKPVRLADGIRLLGYKDGSAGGEQCQLLLDGPDGRRVVRLAYDFSEFANLPLAKNPRKRKP